MTDDDKVLIEAVNNQSKVLAQMVKQQKTTLYLKILGFLGVAAFVGYGIFSSDQGGDTKAMDPLKTSQSVAHLKLKGTIGENADINVDNTIPLLTRAFESKAKGVVIEMDSPGGSPVHSSIIHDKILELKKKHNKKVIVVARDIVASGGYFIATAADKIYVNKSSIIGSIGVIYTGFGAQKLIDTLGIERRVITAGDNKSKFDPFTPMKDHDVEQMKSLLADTHEYFKDSVVADRGKKLKEGGDYFNGDVWSGKQAIANGIADAEGNVYTASEKEFGTQSFVEFNNRLSPFSDVVKNLGADTAFKSITRSVLESLSEGKIQ